MSLTGLSLVISTLSRVSDALFPELRNMIGQDCETMEFLSAFTNHQGKKPEYHCHQQTTFVGLR